MSALYLCKLDILDWICKTPGLTNTHTDLQTFPWSTLPSSLCFYIHYLWTSPCLCRWNPKESLGWSQDLLWKVFKNMVNFTREDERVLHITARQMTFRQTWINIIFNPLSAYSNILNPSLKFLFVLWAPPFLLSFFSIPYSSLLPFWNKNYKVLIPHFIICRVALLYLLQFDIWQHSGRSGPIYPKNVCKSISKWRYMSSQKVSSVS